MIYKQGDIIIMPVPYTDLTSFKRRPVLVVSHDGYNQKQKDLIVMGVTSNTTDRDYIVKFDTADLKSGTILKKSCIRADKIFALDRSVVLKKIAAVSDGILERAIEMLGEAIAPNCKGASRPQ